MALMLGVKRGDMGSWRGAAELLERLRDLCGKETIAFSDEEKLALLKALHDAVTAELVREEEFGRYLDVLLREIASAGTCEVLGARYAAFRETAAAYLLQRRSVVSLFEATTMVGDALFARAAALAAGMLSSRFGDRGACRVCWLVTGEAGRREMPLFGSPGYHLVWAADSDADFGRALAGEMAAALAAMGLAGAPGPAPAVWSGSLAEWSHFVGSTLGGMHSGSFLAALPGLHGPFRALGKAEEEHLAAVAMLSDLRALGGEEALAGEALSAVHQGFAALVRRGLLAHLGRQSASLPVGLGMFGWLKVERLGSHRGEVDILTLAERPLVLNLCILAIHHGVRATNTWERIQSLLASGGLSVDLAGRLVRAYQAIMVQKLRLQAVQGGEGAFLNPEDLSDEEADSLREALEAVVQLQRFVHSQFMEKI